MTIRSHVFLAAFVTAAAAVAVAGAGCGGKKPAATLPDETGGGDMSEPGGEPPPSGGGDGAMVSPETMDEIRRRFDRKRPSVSRCLSAAVDAKELPRNARGKITLNIVIEPGGKAGDIKVVKATLESPLLTECVIGKVREIVFPEVPQAFPTSYTYGFEAM